MAGQVVHPTESVFAAALCRVRPVAHDEGRQDQISHGGLKVKRIIAVLAVALAFAAVAANAADSKAINGWISDSMCGAKHAGSGAACVKKCIEGGMAPVFVDEGKKAGLDHRQSRCGEGFLRRSRDGKGDSGHRQEIRTHRIDRSGQVGGASFPESWFRERAWAVCPCSFRFTKQDAPHPPTHL